MKPRLEDIIVFISDRTGQDTIYPATDILKDLGCCGDDWHEMIDAYASTFNVDISNYLWYFHTPEEGSNFLGGMFFKAPNELVERIKITPNDLYEMAIIGTWNIHYPEHSIPAKRHDLSLNVILLIIIIASFIAWLIYKTCVGE